MDVPLPPGSDGESDNDDVPSVSELPSLPENAESEAESDAAGVESDSGPARQVAQRPSKRCRPTNAGQPLPAPPAPIRLPVYVDAVMEIFSPPRLAPVAKQYGLAAQYSFDKPEWDADDEICRRYLRAILDKQKPYMLVLSPECRMHSILQRDCNLAKMDPAAVAVQQETADQHIALCVDLMLRQASGNRKFVLEQPSSASSWQLPAVQRLLQEVPDARIISFAQCRFGLKDPEGRPLRKSTKFLTNMPSVIKRFANLQCVCGLLGLEHGRIQGQIAGVRVSRWAQQYPPELVEALIQCCKGDLS